MVCRDAFVFSVSEKWTQQSSKTAVSAPTLYRWVGRCPHLNTYPPADSCLLPDIATVHAAAIYADAIGKFDRVVPAGFLCLVPPCQEIKGRVSLALQYVEVSCDTKTKDNVFVRVSVAVQFKVEENSVPSAFYKLTDRNAQIRSYVFDVVRSSFPRLELDESFASKDDVARAVKEQLSALMKEYGYVIVAALVIDIDPDARVKASMNEINASQRLRVAAAEKAEAEKILQVKAAEADGESKYLSGMGVAKQRQAIVDGLRETVSTFTSVCSSLLHQRQLAPCVRLRLIPSCRYCCNCCCCC